MKKKRLNYDEKLNHLKRKKRKCQDVIDNYTSLPTLTITGAVLLPIVGLGGIIFAPLAAYGVLSGPLALIITLIVAAISFGGAITYWASKFINIKKFNKKIEVMEAQKEELVELDEINLNIQKQKEILEQEKFNLKEREKSIKKKAFLIRKLIKIGEKQKENDKKEQEIQNELNNGLND